MKNISRISFLLCLTIVFKTGESMAASAKVLTLIESQKYLEALSLPDLKFSDSEDSKALEAFLIYKNNLPKIGLEKLFAISNPKKISAAVKNLWKNEIKSDSPALLTSKIQWSNSWKDVFTDTVAATILASQTGPITNKKQLANAEDVSFRLDPKSPLKWDLQWKIAMYKAITNDITQASKILNKLDASDQVVIGDDQIAMAKARINYQNNKLDAAIQGYDSISKSSDYWLESIEEKAWAHLRQGHGHDAIADLQTLMTPSLAPQVGPETYFLASFSNLKICDYKSILKLHNEFKTRYKDRITALQTLAKTGDSAAAAGALEKMKSGPISWVSVGRDVQWLPRFFHRDEILKAGVAELVESGKEQSTIAQYLSTSTNPSLKSNLDKLMVTAKKNVQVSLQKTHARMKHLAEDETKEMSTMIRKLHIVEAELIQRMYVNNRLATNELEGKQNKDDDLIFPHGTEIWLDELTHYQTRGKGCPAPALAEKTL